MQDAMTPDPPRRYVGHPVDAKLLAFARTRPESQPIGVVEAASGAGCDPSAASYRIVVLRSVGLWPWPPLRVSTAAKSDAALRGHISKREARCKPR
jgi:hypothetical protein